MFIRWHEDVLDMSRRRDPWGYPTREPTPEEYARMRSSFRFIRIVYWLLIGLFFLSICMLVYLFS